MGTVTHEDIDGTKGPGVAMLVMIKPVGHEVDPEMMWERLVEGTVTNPARAAWALRDSVREDWPEHEFAVIKNERAAYLLWRERMQAILGPTEGSIEAYLAMLERE